MKWYLLNNINKGRINMKSYLLTTESKEVKEALVYLPIDNYPMNIGGKEGIVVNSPSFEDLSKSLESYLDDCGNIENISINFIGPTQYEGISAVSIYSGKRKKVSVKDWNGSNCSDFVSVTSEVLGTVVSENINIYVPHGVTRQGRKTGFNIYIWSAPSGSRERECVSSFWGIRVDCKDSVFDPTYKGTVITDNNSNPVAELIDNNLYIFHDICHHGTGRELQIYRHILEEVVKNLSLTSEDRDILLKEKNIKNRNVYIDLCMRRMDDERKNLVKKISQAKDNVDKYRKDLIRNIRVIEEESFLVENFESALSERKEVYGKEYDKLLELDKVIGVEVSSRGIDVYTKNLYCIDPRTKNVHDIGEFRISIPIGSGHIIWNNLTRRVYGYSEGMHAPHVFKEGKACLGNAEQVLPDLIAKYQFSIIAMYAIQFIESVNVEDSAGSRITQWPVVEKPKDERDE